MFSEKMKTYLMSYIKHIVAIAGLFCALALITAKAQSPVSNPSSNVVAKLGRHYFPLTKPQAVESKDKIEIIEFFAYFCGHCYKLDAPLSAWARKNSQYVNFKRIHSNVGNFSTHQRLFYSLDTLGRLDDLHMKVFQAYHLERKRMRSDEEVMDFVKNVGIDPVQFAQVYQSFTVNLKLQRNWQILTAYNAIHEVPLLAIDGRFMTSVAIVGNATNPNVSEEMQIEETLKVLDFLVDKLRKEKNLK
jgi:thiol:disulfide interchange protein DsbA